MIFGAWPVARILKQHSLLLYSPFGLRSGIMLFVENKVDVEASVLGSLVIFV